MDADYSHPPVFICDLWESRNSADIIIASRYIRGGKADMPISRYLLSRVLNTFFGLGLNIPVRDMSSGYRLYSATVIRDLEIECSDFDVLQEILVRAVINNFRIQEIPFAYSPRKHGSSHARVFKFGIAYLKTFRRLWLLRNTKA
jgi:dolichol-phosphate mannosyltransferase